MGKKKKAAATTPSSDQNGPRLFEFNDGKSQKFWKIELSGNSYTVTFGRMGTDGQTKTKEFANEAKASASYEKLISQKTGKGYTEVKAGGVSESEQRSSRRKMLKAAEPFIQAICDDPDNVAGFAVYSDWLAEQGDPLSELMQVQVSLEDASLKPASRKKLQTQEKALLKKHAREWLGELAAFLIDGKGGDDDYVEPEYKYQFGRGVLEWIHVVQCPEEFAAALKRSHHCRTLRKLVIEETYEDDGLGLEPLVGAKLDCLREFTHGERSYGDYTDSLVKTMPKLQKLVVEANNVETDKLFKAKMPNLTTLVVHHQSEYPVELLAKNASLTKLERLEMFPHALEYGEEEAYLTLDDFKAIARSKPLKNLKHLQFRSSDMGDAGVDELISSGLLGRLETLDLSYGCISDEGAERLAAAADLKTLKSLALEGNGLTPKGAKAFKKTVEGLGVKVNVLHQFKINEDDEFKEYLSCGDME